MPSLTGDGKPAAESRIGTPAARNEGQINALNDAQKCTRRRLHAPLERLKTGLFSRFVVPAKPPDPDIAKSHARIVILQNERVFGRLRNIMRNLAVDCRPH